MPCLRVSSCQTAGQSSLMSSRCLSLVPSCDSCGEVEAASSPITTTAAAAATSTSTSKTAKELPPGYWQAQVAKYEKVKIGGECRKFPQEILLGTEAILARVVIEMKSLSHTSLALHELVQHHFFSKGGDPNPLCPAKKRAKASTAVLLINQDNQLETAPDASWSPKSLIAFLDCLEAIRYALVEMGPEPAVHRYMEWWEKQVRARQSRLEQLKIYWDITAWRVAMALRSKVDFATVTNEIINDNQALQDALSREVMTDKHASTKAGKQETYRWEFARGKGKGKHGWKDLRPAWDDAGYDRPWSDRKWDDSRFGPYKQQWSYGGHHDRQHDKSSYQRANAQSEQQARE